MKKPRRRSSSLGCIPSVLLLAVLLPFAGLHAGYRALRWLPRELALRREWRREHGRSGREFLVVYSGSSPSRDWIETKLLPALGASAVAVDCARDRSWQDARSLPRRMHAHAGRPGERVPVVYGFPPWLPTRVFRLRAAARELRRHGREDSLAEVLERLLASRRRSTPA